MYKRIATTSASRGSSEIYLDKDANHWVMLAYFRHEGRLHCYSVPLPEPDKRHNYADMVTQGKLPPGAALTNFTVPELITMPTENTQRS